MVELSNMPVICRKGTRAQLNTLITNSSLVVGELLYVTDENNHYVARSTNVVDLMTLNSLDQIKNKITYFTDCFSANASCFNPFLGAVLSNGNINTSALSVQNRPGMVRARSGTNANSGYFITTAANALLLKGNETFLCGVIFNSVVSTTVHRLGFIDTVSINDCTDGVYFEISNSLINTRTANNSVITSGSSNLAISALTYYWLSISLNSNATVATFKVFSEAGSLLFNSTTNTNIPTTSGRETGVGIIAHNTLAVASDLYTLDFLGFGLDTGRPILNV
jgi:hypothetical protein